MKESIVALISGTIAGLGLCISGMINPRKVIAFLDIFGSWDPSLGVVMMGALLVSVVAFQYYLPKRSKPFFSAEFSLPTSQKIDWKLIAGAILFGVGWGMGGSCPAPAVASLVYLLPKSAVFVISMLTGMMLFQLLKKLNYIK